jgi:hypothetical protein
MSPKETNFWQPLTTRAVTGWLLFSLMAALILVLASTPAHAQTKNFVPNPLQNPICSKIGNKIQVSLGLRMYCFGPQPNGPGTSPTTTRSSSGITSYSGGGGTSGFSPNVDAASLAEDITPAGVRAYGQSETSIAASGSYVVEAWNDSTGFFSPCPSPMYKEELTGVGFSNDGGNTFTDIGGLPNSNCANDLYFGDASVEAYQVGGVTYFYISSLYMPVFGSVDPATSKIALSVCTVIGSGSSATLSCSQPVIAAKSSNFFSFVDKDFMTIDPVKKRLYISYTDFGGFSDPNVRGEIDVAACDITTPTAPDCQNGGMSVDSGTPALEYLVVAQGDMNCEQEGAYPAVDKMTGDVYVAWEFNWATNFLNGAPCNSTPTRNVLAYVAFTPCLAPAGAPAATSSCTPPRPSTAVAITSMDAAFIPGYNRFPMNDFPRIAVSDWAGTVSIVWNDAGRNPGGDILLQSFHLGSSLTRIGLAPVKVNNDNGLGTFHFLPALRNADSNGKIGISWYDRRLNPRTALTDVFAAVGISPLITSTPTSNQRVTDTASNWLAVSSDGIPNFGDYTDIYWGPPPPSRPDDDPWFVAWSDGRLSVPQPFESHTPVPASH